MKNKPERRLLDFAKGVKKSRLQEIDQKIIAAEKLVEDFTGERRRLQKLEHEAPICEISMRPVDASGAQVTTPVAPNGSVIHAIEEALDEAAHTFNREFTDRDAEFEVDLLFHGRRYLLPKKVVQKLVRTRSDVRLSYAVQ